MKITLNYEKRSYGTSDDESDYAVKISKSEDEIDVNFDFLLTASGRGLGDTAGSIESALLTFNTNDAIKIAEMIMSVAAQDKTSPTEQNFGTYTKELNVAHRRMREWNRRNPDASAEDRMKMMRMLWGASGATQS